VLTLEPIVPEQLMESIHGVYLMLTPLSQGSTRSIFHADVIAGGQVDATYFITVSHGQGKS
jgi:hypothetical protein